MKTPPTLTTMIVALVLQTEAVQAVVFTSSTILSAGDLAYDGQTIVVSNCTLTVNGPHTFAGLWLTNGAVLTHSPAPGGETNNRLDLTVSGDVMVDDSSRMDVSGCGYAASSGPGAGGDLSDNGGGGGSHGGSGGHGLHGPAGGSAYDLIVAPAQWGSGGGVGYLSTPGVGGGRMRLTVVGELRVEGSLLADGTGSSRPGGLGSYGGGGSGGSLWLTTGTLAGSGIIQANGGSGVNGGGGAGGRIAVICSNNVFAGTLRAIGGTGFQAGGAGSIFTQTNAALTGQTRIDNGGQADGLTQLRAEYWPAGTTSDLLCTGSALVYPQGPLTLASLRVNGNSVLSHGAAENTFDLTVTGNAVIETNGQINVAGQGYPYGTGPGAGWYAFNGNAGGGGHGGGGGGAQIPYSFQGGGGTYDSPTRPLDFGSGGGDYRGGAGGGAIRLDVYGTLQLDGSINASGASATDGHYGGGACGCLFRLLQRF